jgi:hypothetical protein
MLSFYKELKPPKKAAHKILNQIWCCKKSELTPTNYDSCRRQHTGGAPLSLQARRMWNRTRQLPPMVFRLDALSIYSFLRQFRASINFRSKNAQSAQPLMPKRPTKGRLAADVVQRQLYFCTVFDWT